MITTPGDRQSCYACACCRIPSECIPNLSTCFDVESVQEVGLYVFVSLLDSFQLNHSWRCACLLTYSGDGKRAPLRMQVVLNRLVFKIAHSVSRC